MRRFLFLSALLLLGAAMACGGGSSSTPPPTGTLTLRLGSDSFLGYDQVVVGLEKVEASNDGNNWVPLGDVKATFDLMALQNGHSAIILPTTRMSTRSFTMFRLTWATVNYQPPVVGQAPQPPAYVIPSGGSGLLLSMPVTTIVNGPVTITANADTVAQIMLRGQDAVQSRPGPPSFIQFQPTCQIMDLAATAHITGSLADDLGPLAHVEVFAETLDGSLNASIQRRAFTDGNGNYTLEGLPTGALYFVVAQPAGSTTSYPAASSAPVDASSANGYVANLSFSSASAQMPGALSLTISQASAPNQTCWGELRQTLATGPSTSQALIVRSATVDTGLYQDQVAFTGLTPGIYGVAAQRSTAGAAPVMKVGISAVPVYAGATAIGTLSYP